jgi:segregation and condensation protein B
MDAGEIKYFIEAALLAAGRPLSVDQLQKLFDGRMAPEKQEIRQAIAALVEEYEPRGITISEVASGFRVQVKSAMADQLQKLWEERPPRYSRALFETLALVAYRQPITRGEIEEVRGVSVSPNIVRTLVERDWVRVVGHRDVPGRPEMFGTTKLFLDYFGLKKLDDLPPLADLSDWESLRVQLDLPEVEEDQSEEQVPLADVPVLYPEGTTEEAPEDLAEEAEVRVPDEIADLVRDEDKEEDDELIVSKWPDPAESGG